MQLACQTCQARYRIADEKVHGRIVKIRCRKCGAVVVADGSGAPPDDTEPAAGAPTVRTGQRQEQSVLFSLAALQQARRPAIPTAPAGEPSGLIDLRALSAALASTPRPSNGPDAVAHLSVVGTFAPLFDGTYEPAAEARPSRSQAFVLVPATALTLVGLFVLTRTLDGPANSVAAATRSSAPIPVTSTPSATSEPMASAPIPPPGSVTARPEVPATTKAQPTASPTPRDPTRVPAEPIRSCCPGEDTTTCEMRRSVGRACAATAAATPLPFDAVAASRALGSVDLRRCGTGGSADGHARVTFQPSGAVSNVVVDTPELSGTAPGHCVADAYRRVQVATFAGPALTVGKRFRLGPDA